MYLVSSLYEEIIQGEEIVQGRKLYEKIRYLDVMAIQVSFVIKQYFVFKCVRYDKNYLLKIGPMFVGSAFVSFLDPRIGFHGTLCILLKTKNLPFGNHQATFFQSLLTCITRFVFQKSVHYAAHRLNLFELLPESKPILF